MTRTYLGYELGKVYFENESRNIWGVYEFIDKSLFHTTYQSALIEGEEGVCKSRTTKIFMGS